MLRLRYLGESVMTEQWIQDLLDIGVGWVAMKAQYNMARGISTVKVCPYCGTKPRKYAVVCPKCRRKLPQKRRS